MKGRTFISMAVVAVLAAVAFGAAMDYNGFGWEHRPKPPTSEELLEATRSYFEYTIEHFGVDRCLFESNFPVDRRSISYPVLWNAFKKIAAKYSESEKTDLFSGTASRIYRLD